MNEIVAACSCDKCVYLCEQNPGWFEPREAILAIEAGFAGRLMLDWLEPCSEVGNEERIYVLAAASVGHEGREAPDIPDGPGAWLLIGNWSKGRCTFLDKDKKCEIHNSGFKPVQCRLASGCDKEIAKGCPDNYAVAKLWDCQEGQKVVKQWKDQLC